MPLQACLGVLACHCHHHHRRCCCCCCHGVCVAGTAVVRLLREVLRVRWSHQRPWKRWWRGEEHPHPDEPAWWVPEIAALSPAVCTPA